MSFDDFLHKFQKALSFSHHYDEVMWTALMPYASIKRLRKNTLLTSRSFDAYLVATGTLGLQDSVHDGILHFIPSNSIVPDAHLDEDLAYYALEETILIVLPLDTLPQLLRQFPQLYYVQRDILKNWFRETNHRTYLLQLPKKERKSAFKKLFPAIPGRVPNFMIAHYLSMSPEYFSRTGW